MSSLVCVCVCVAVVVVVVVVVGAFSGEVPRIRTRVWSQRTQPIQHTKSDYNPVHMAPPFPSLLLSFSLHYFPSTSPPTHCLPQHPSQQPSIPCFCHTLHFCITTIICITTTIICITTATITITTTTASPDLPHHR